MTGDLAAGMLLAAGAALCFEGGYALQAYEARRAPSEASLRPSLLLHLARRRVWLGAAWLLVLGWPLQVAALGFAPLTVVQPTLALGLLLLLAFAARFLHERVGPGQIVGVVGIAIGTGVIAWAAPGHTESHGSAVQLALALAPLTAVTLTPYAVMAASWLRRRVTSAGRRPTGPVALAATSRVGWALMLSAGAADAWAAIATKLISDELGQSDWPAALAWAVPAGVMFGLGLLSEMTALQRMRASRVGPTVLAMQVGLPVALAPVALGESWSGTPLGGAAIALGLAVVVAGVALLSGSGPVERLAEAERQPVPAG